MMKHKLNNRIHTACLCLHGDKLPERDSCRLTLTSIDKNMLTTIPWLQHFVEFLTHTEREHHTQFMVFGQDRLPGIQNKLNSIYFL